MMLLQRREFAAAAVLVLPWLLAIDPGRCEAQRIGWTVAPSLLLDTEFTGGTEIGPGITAEIELNAHRTLSYWAGLTLARTDFPLGADELHRNFGAAALGVRLMRDGDRPALGLLLGIGALLWDDVPETDPALRSSANAEELIVAGLELRWPLRGGWGITLSARDLVTGWWWAVLDPGEGEFNHRFVIAAGVYRR